MGLGAAMKLMKNKQALDAVVHWHDVLFRYLGYLGIKDQYTPEQQDKFELMFKEGAEMYIEVLKVVGLLPEVPPAADKGTENPAKAV
jgi:hypothetical protein